MRGMTEERNQEVLEILNFELNRKDMVVLGALLKSQPDPSSFVDFETIRTQLEIDEGGKKGKDSLIYRSLSWLEKNGFIRVDRSEHKHGYNSNVSLMHQVFQRAISGITQDTAKELEEINADVEKISNMDLMQLREDMIAFAAGKQEIERPVFAEGWKDVLDLIEDKVYNGLKKGDIIRFSLDWFNRTDVLTPYRVERLGQLMASGVIFQGLEHNRISKEQREAFVEFRQTYGEQGYLPGYKVCEKQDSTYQFVGRNDEGIVLIVSENPMSATWIPRSSNRDLVENAILTFDEDYNEAVDITEIGSD